MTILDLKTFSQPGNAIVLLTLLKDKAVVNPPLKENGIQPYGLDSLVGILEGLIKKFKAKLMS
jgi:hypothetical protein